MRLHSSAAATALAFAVMGTAPAFAVDWTYNPLGGIATTLTGGYGAVANPSDGSVYGDGFSYSYPVIVDTGSSGFLMSQTVTEYFGVPLQYGQTYLETGLGGSEIMNVTQPVIAYYSPASNNDPDDISTMTAYGTYTFESRQSDPLPGFVYFDIIGTPVLQSRVMVVTPGQRHNLVQFPLGFLTAETVLQATAPVLPSTGRFHVPITWTNFVTGTPVPTQGLNPVVTGVTSLGPNGTPNVADWLFDTGAQFTMIDPTYASSVLGVNLSNPINTIEGMGVGGETVQFDEFQISELVLPLANGDRLVFQDPYIWVPVGQSLPAGLVGILGENLFMQSADEIDPNTGMPVGTHAPLFAQWYLDGPGSQLVLYDPDAVAPPPTWSGTTNTSWSTQASDVNWSGSPWTNNANRSTPNTATFSLATAASVTVNGNIDVSGITFTTGGWTLAVGTGVLAYGATGAINITTTTGTSTINAIIADGWTFGSGGGVTAVIKSGPGVLVLGGANTYLGGTAVNGGTLLVSNSTGSATGSGPVTLNAGILGGYGTIAGTVVAGSAAHTIAPSATLTPGSHGTLTMGALSTSANTTLAFNLVSFATNDTLKITANNGLTLNGGQLQIISAPTGIASIGYYKIIQYTGSIQGAGLASITLPDVANGISYFLTTSHDAGFIDVHRGFVGDADDSGLVDLTDLTTLASHWQQTGTWQDGDFNHSGSIDLTDLTMLAGQWQDSIDLGSVAGSLNASDSFGEAVESLMGGSVPEPGTLLLLGLGALALARRRRNP